MFRFHSSKLLVVALVVLVFASAAYAFAANNIVPSSYAGEGAGTVSGYTVTNLVYNLNAGNPSNIDSVSFHLNAAATNVQVRLATTGAFYPTTACSNTGLDWTCTTAGATVAAADEFRVIARDH